ncbi:hypothetical protein BKA67DRAFT_530748 [Truncatella angustata]|uniref:DUF4038 domain-containing protein n=1 Tax=Truncatella angustata TaxID=152316 RepID=A0A9P8UYW1_9PEZI|nr:uncharacterized protein BKA67DRAFT_530748 [Truncatella angustata]KAH6660660.1 hypothetical protein BKA67DRAFT_530748 [Truncatella angustata]KAH8199300.1 hypothetical protein TruAng_006536 [Truncatella angustata]
MRLADITASVLTVAATFVKNGATWQVPAEYGITPSPDGHFLQDSHGSPFFWQADTAWLLFHRLNYSEAELYLSDRASKGYNVVLAVGFTQVGIDSPNRNDDLPFVDEDVTQPNELYWEFVDSIVELAWSKGVRIALVPAWGKYVHSNDNEGSVLNITTGRPFGDFIGRRYPYLPKLLVADTNPWWQNKTAVKDNYSKGGAAPNYNHTDWGYVYDELAEGIVQGELATIALQTKQSPGILRNSSTWTPLITIHPTNQWFTNGPIALASAFLGDRSWLTFDASQSGHADYAPNPPIPWWNCRRGWEAVELMYAAGETSEGVERPALDNEPHYENRYNNGKSGNAYWNASDVRVGSWQSVLSGAAGVTYGANNVMQMYIPELYTQDGSGPAYAWSLEISLPGSNQIQYITKAIMDRGEGSYFKRLPAQYIITSDAGTNDKRVTAARDSQGSWIMVYTPTGLPFSVETQSLNVCNVEGSWFDPLVGTYASFQYSQCNVSNSTRREFTPPSTDAHVDWLLVLEAK